MGKAKVGLSASQSNGMYSDSDATTSWMKEPDIGVYCENDDGAKAWFTHNSVRLIHYARCGSSGGIPLDGWELMEGFNYPMAGDLPRSTRSNGVEYFDYRADHPNNLNYHFDSWEIIKHKFKIPEGKVWIPVIISSFPIVGGDIGGTTAATFNDQPRFFCQPYNGQLEFFTEGEGTNWLHDD